MQWWEAKLDLYKDFLYLIKEKVSGCIYHPLISESISWTILDPTNQRLLKFFDAGFNKNVLLCSNLWPDLLLQNQNILACICR